MRFLREEGLRVKGAVALIALIAPFALTGAAWLSGCGTPGAPQPPSLKLPEPVFNLTAVRAGDTVTLHWTMPRKTTDRLPLASQARGSIPARVCVRSGLSGDCATVSKFAFAPGMEADAKTSLAGDLVLGEPRQLFLFVELENFAGRSAGLSNAALVVGGAAPSSVESLNAEVRADGVALRWKATGAGSSEVVRLHRELLTPATTNVHGKEKRTTTEPILRDLLVETPASTQESGALDASASFGEVYAYTAQRVERVTLGGKQLELASALSAPITVSVEDTFPPAVPTGLVSVPVAEEKSIDLSWQPDTEKDLAGYIVYRADAPAAEQASNPLPNTVRKWVRISGADPVVGPAYRDSTVQPGHSYFYGVSAIDRTNHESNRSAESRESMPELGTHP